MASLQNQDDDLQHESSQPQTYRHSKNKIVISQQLHDYFYSGNQIRQSLPKIDGAVKLLHDINRFDDEYRLQLFALIDKVYDESEVHDFYTDYNYALIQIRGQNIDRAEHIYKNLVKYDNLSKIQISKRHELEIVINFLQGNYGKVSGSIKEFDRKHMRSKVNATHVVSMALKYLKMDDINPMQQFNMGTERSITVDNLITGHRSLLVKFDNGSIISFKTGVYIHFIDNNFEFFKIQNFCEVAKQFFMNPNLWLDDQEIKSLITDANNLAGMCEQYMHYSPLENERMQAKTILKTLALSGNPQATKSYINFLNNSRPRAYWHQNEQPIAQQLMDNKSTNLR